MNYLNETLSEFTYTSLQPISDVEAQIHLRPSLYAGLCAALILFCVKTAVFATPTGNAAVNAPVVGPQGLLTRFYFMKNAWQYIMEGYEKYGDSMYKVSGNDILILPRKYVDELRNLPDHKVSSIQANIDNFEGDSSLTSLLLEGDLHTFTIQHSLTPKLGLLVHKTQAELNNVLPRELAASADKYTDIKAFPLILRLVSNIAARHFVGYPTCENEEWINNALQYTENVFRTIIFIRMFPDSAKPFLKPFSPWAYKAKRALKKAQDMIVPVILERKRAEAEDPRYEKPTDFLQMMMDNANEVDGEPHKLAHRLLILTLAAVHTTSMAATQTLFDMCAHPEYMDILREEVQQIQASDNGFRKQSLTKMKKLDSFMRESQRLNPPSLLGFKRAIREPYTLSDGFVLPKDAHIMMPVYPIVVDPSVTERPKQFDGLRFYHTRQIPGEANKHQFTTTSNTNMHFGHGKFGCPGRFFAANSIKIVLSTLLLRYDFGLKEGQSRPENMTLHEYVFPNPEATIQFKLRE